MTGRSVPGVGSTRWRRILRAGWPLAVLVTVPLATFSPVLFGGYTLYPADLLHEAYLPFAASRSGTNIQVTAIIDLLHEYYPSRVFVRQSVREGRIPLWSPYIYGGHPVFAGNASRATLDPFNLFYFLPDLPTALAWRTFAQVVACALFMYLYL
ncbi:MAG: hypothetical protein HY552_05695, partial [Elusimicrobia bacterium]|nr:hypothetical protein [Elusimicrobiota bacterium]